MELKVPSHSRGGLGRGWVSVAIGRHKLSTETHPHPGLPLEGERVFTESRRVYTLRQATRRLIALERKYAAKN